MKMHRTMLPGMRKVSGFQRSEKSRRKIAAPLQTLAVGTKLANAEPSGGKIYRIHEGCIVLSRRLHVGPAQRLDGYGLGSVFIHPGAPN